jgi:hypothetical protein
VNDGTGQWSDAQAAVRSLASTIPAELQIAPVSLPARVYIPLAIR